MKTAILIRTLLVFAALASLACPAFGEEQLPDYLYSKGGIIYPRTGDSTQAIFRTPPNATNFLKPGMLIGVLPEDCISDSQSSIGSYYICHHDLALQPEEHEGKTVYRVIKAR